MPAGGAEVEGGVVPDMAAQVFRRSPDSIILALARRQNGVVTHAQLIAEGLTRHQVGLRITDGRLQVLHRGVYLVGAIPSEHAYAQAALLALGSEALLSHFSAAKLWRLRDHPVTAHPWVTIPAAKRTERTRIEVRHADVGPVDRRRRYLMSLTSPPRTVLDCAAVLEDAYEVEALIAEAQFRRLANRSEMEINWLETRASAASQSSGRSSACRGDQDALDQRENELFFDSCAKWTSTATTQIRRCSDRSSTSSGLS